MAGRLGVGTKNEDVVVVQNGPGVVRPCDLTMRL
jgi:hypothetical protein